MLTFIVFYIIVPILLILVGVCNIILRGYNLYRRACRLFEGVETLPSCSTLFRFGIGHAYRIVLDLVAIKTTASRVSSTETPPKNEEFDSSPPNLGGDV